MGKQGWCVDKLTYSQHGCKWGWHTLQVPGMKTPVLSTMQQSHACKLGHIGGAMLWASCCPVLCCAMLCCAVL
jgi:hypothetical protein